MSGDIKATGTTDGPTTIYDVPVDQAHLVQVFAPDAKEVMRIEHSGRIFWRDREVETDDDFRSAMLELRNAMIASLSHVPPQPPPPIEQAIAAEGADKAPRVTQADIENAIVSEHYFTARDGVVGATPDGGVFPDPPALKLLTFCVLVLKNGFTATGESACVSPENYNEGIGRRIARENAVDKLWPLLGYALREKLYEESHG